MMNKRRAIIFSAPSGAGKTTIVKHILSTFPTIEFSTSAATRSKRGKSETDGKDYYFLSLDEFKQKIDNEEFAEWEEVYAGSFYGTLKSEIQRIWAKGHHLIFDVDVKGGISLKKYLGENALAIFVKVKDLNVLTERLQNRGTESEKSLAKRHSKAKFEMSFEKQFDVTLVNNHLEDACKYANELVSDFINQKNKYII